MQYFLASDGACRSNHTKTDENNVASWAAVCTDATGDIDTRSGIIEGLMGTNVRAELKGAIEALRLAPVGAAGVLYTDSKFVVDGINSWIHGWLKRNWKNASGKRVAHVDLWEEMYQMHCEREIKVVWVKGHSGHELNEIADKICNEALDAHIGHEPSHSKG